jgi:hypothetical protein
MPETVSVDIKVLDMPEVQAALETLADEITRLQRELTDKTVALAVKEIELISSESVTLRNGWRDGVERLRAALMEIDTYLANDPDVWRIVSVAKAGDVLCDVLGSETIQGINASVEARLCASCQSAITNPAEVDSDE